MWITETQCEWNWARVAELFWWRTTVATVLIGVLSPTECDGRAVVLPSTGVVESRGVECDGEVVRRTSVTYRRRERPCLVAAFPCRTCRCCSGIVTPAAGRRRLCSCSRHHPFDTVGWATTATPFPWPGLTDGRRCWCQVVVESEQARLPVHVHLHFSLLQLYPFFWAILLPSVTSVTELCVNVLFVHWTIV